MDLKRKKKQIYIDREAWSVLEMIQEGILFPATSLMNEAQVKEVNQTGIFQGVSFPSPLVFAPNGKRNQKVIEGLKSQDEVDLYVCDQKIGTLQVESVFKIDKEERVRKIVGGDLGHPETPRISQRIGNYAVYGEVKVMGRQIAQNKRKIAQKIQELDAKRICGVMLNANPIHKVHEKILQEALLENDLLLIFVPQHGGQFLSFDLRMRCLEYVVSNFLPSKKILIIPIDYTYCLSGQNRMILNALICKNYGCTDYIASLGSSDLGTFFKGDCTHTIMDSVQGLELCIHVLSEYIYCNVCNTIKSTRTCPHGKHCHISYDSKNFFEMFRFGLIPPELFVRKEVSAMILTSLFPGRVKSFNKLYSDLMSKDGIMQTEEEKFYENLLRLYHVK